MLNLLTLHQVPILPCLLPIMVMKVVAEEISPPTLIKEEVEVLVRVMEVVWMEITMLETLVGETPMEVEILIEIEVMVAYLARITIGIILANLSASFFEGLDMKLEGVTTGLIQVFFSPTSFSQNGGGPCAYFNQASLHSSALFTIPKMFNDNSWYHDSGASNHVTPNVVIVSTTLNLLVKTKCTLVMVQIFQFQELVILL